MSCSMFCPHCEKWSTVWKSVERDKPKEMFDTWTCSCGGSSVWFGGAMLPLRADSVDSTIKWRKDDATKS